jgi:hypothetical protein
MQLQPPRILVDRLQELLESEKLPFNNGLREKLPKNAGVYRNSEYRSDDTKSVYVGQTRNLRQRIWGDHVIGDRIASTLKRKLIKAGGDETSVRSPIILRQSARSKCSR